MELVALDPIHTVILVLSLMGLLMCLAWLASHPHKHGYIWLPLLVFANMFAYNVVLYAHFNWSFCPLTLTQLEMWSAVIRVQVILSLMAYVLVPMSRPGEISNGK